MKLILVLKGGSLSKTEVYTDRGHTWVRKSISVDNEREYGIVRWQSQLRKLQLLRERLPNNVVPIHNAGLSNGYYFYDMPYVSRSYNLVEALHNGINPTLISEKLSGLIRNLASFQFNSIKGSISVYLNEELRRPMLVALKFLSKQTLYLTPNEASKLSYRISASLDLVDELIAKHGKTILYECLTHGNFTLENAMWNDKTQDIIMIDPYGETYCETILGDVSQILQSSLSGYEFVSNYIQKQKYSVINYPYDKIPEQLTDFARIFEQQISKELWYDEEIVLLLRASQFTRMFPFKLVNNAREGVLFMNHAIDLLGQIKCSKNR